MHYHIEVDKMKICGQKKKKTKTNKKQINESLFPLKNLVLIYPNKYDSKNLKRN